MRKAIAVTLLSLIGLVPAFGQEAEPAPTATAAVVEEILFDQDLINLVVGKSFQIFVYVSPDEAVDKSLRWSSSDRKVAIVGPTGKVTAVGPGFAYIVAQTPDGRVSASASVFVTAAGEPPSVDPKLSTALKAEAGVTYGTDLDTGKSAFVNPAKVSLVIDLVTGGENATTSQDEIWGEIKVSTKGDPFRLKADNAENGSSLSVDQGFRIRVDYAKIHVGKMMWVKLKGLNQSKNSNESNMVYLNYLANPDRSFAVVGADTTKRYGVLKPQSLTQDQIAQDFAVPYGVEAGITFANLGTVTFDFGSTLPWDGGSDESTATGSPLVKETDWGYRSTFSFEAIDNFVAEAGFSAGVAGGDAVTLPDAAFGGKVGYQWDFFDKYYLMPKVGVTWIQLDGIGPFYPVVSGGVRLGFEEKGDAFKFWDNDYSALYVEDSSGAWPGISAGVRYAHEALTDSLKDVMSLNVSFNSGTVVDRLQFVGAWEVVDVLADKVKQGVTAGVAYEVPYQAMKVTPKFLGTRYWDAGNPDADYLYFKGALEIKDLFPHVNFDVNYESNELVKGFDNGYGYQKKGKLETSVKVSF